MCNNPFQYQGDQYQNSQSISPPAEISPEEKLAKLMREDLGVNVSARELRMFLRANWEKVSLYAHRIHEK